MKKIITIISFLMILGQVGNLDLGAELNKTVIIKILTLLGIFYLTTKNTNKTKGGEYGRKNIRRTSSN